MQINNQIFLQSNNNVFENCPSSSADQGSINIQVIDESDCVLYFWWNQSHSKSTGRQNRSDFGEMMLWFPN